MTTLAFVDIETTSLARPFSATPGEVWEVGLIVRGENDLGTFESEHSWLLPVTLEHADPVSLDIGRFNERHPQGDRYTGTATVTPLLEFVAEFGDLLTGAHLVGNVVSFDEERLAAIFLDHGVVGGMPWHYHLIDVEALAVGYLRGMHDVVIEYGIPTAEADSYGASVVTAAVMHAQPRWDSEALSAALGVVVPDDSDRHTALGDARWAKAIYDAVMGTTTKEQSQ